MVTTDIVEKAWRDVVTSHVAGLSFTSDWQSMLDTERQPNFPASFWGPVTTAVVHGPNLVGRSDTFDISIFYLDQTATDRSRNERDAAHARMDAIARQCWLRFHELYILNTTKVQGVTLDLGDSLPRFLPVYDTVGQHLTGVRMEVTLTVVGYDECLTNYFT